MSRIAKARRVTTHVRPGVTRTVEAIVLKALNKRREDRYQSAGEMARDIANYLSGKSTLAAGKPDRSGAAFRWIAVAAGLAAVVTIGWVAFNGASRPEANPPLAIAPATPIAPALPITPAPPAAPVAPPAVIVEAVGPTTTPAVENLSSAENSRQEIEKLFRPEPPATNDVPKPTTKLTVERAGSTLSVTCPGGSLTVTKLGDSLRIRTPDASQLVPMTGLTDLLLTAGAGDDSIDIDDTGAINVTIEAGKGENRVRLGASTGLLSEMTGKFTIEGGGECAVELNDADSSSADAYTINGESITRAGGGDVTLSGCTGVSLRAGRAPEDVKLNRKLSVFSTKAGMTYHVSTGGGSGSISVGSDQEGATLDQMRGRIQIRVESDFVVNFFDRMPRRSVSMKLADGTFKRDGIELAAVNYVAPRKSGLIQITLPSKAPATLDIEPSSFPSVAVYGGPDEGHVINIAPRGRSLAMPCVMNLATGGTINLFDDQSIEPDVLVWKPAFLYSEPADVKRVNIFSIYPNTARFVLHASPGSVLKALDYKPDALPLEVIAPEDFTIERTAGYPEAGIRRVRESKP